MIKILAFSGSARKESFNHKLVKIAAAAAERAGADVQVINLGSYPMPLMNQDLEQESGVPEAAKELKALITEADGLLIASPEYNSAFSPLLKNCIDWVSRPTYDNEPMLSAYRGKYAGIMSASPGGLGGMRGLVFLRMLLQNIGVTVLPQQHAVSGAGSAFTDNGQLSDSQQQQTIEDIGKALVTTLQKLKAD
ncbi:Non-specific serine/threonine protein kinase [Saliniradius amylolyticus]|uniref:Non-specific serine/threonine protein kinase n=1 Tax=Saliniradius amylolyticus TaxID=2183582 RepID=A0A2S2E4R0_9ALTE|nr:NAD(P)H-dependent oxidoreductase [Saliniradius amylolyticus]AWL12646.1 Non-specific serine/threonine protein kinase [Saliniradius amylolyticus]